MASWPEKLFYVRTCDLFSGLALFTFEGVGGIHYGGGNMPRKTKEKKLRCILIPAKEGERGRVECGIEISPREASEFAGLLDFENSPGLGAEDERENGVEGADESAVLAEAMEEGEDLGEDDEGEDSDDELESDDPAEGGSADDLDDED